MPSSQDPILPITNMAGPNAASKQGKKKRVLVVGAGAAGQYNHNMFICVLSVL